jgi:hypothetical protein
MKKQKAKEQKITGIVLPAEWDDDNNVIRVAIETEDYDEYLVENNEKGKELLALIDFKVEATGTVRQRDGDMIISVKRYESTAEYDEDEDDDDEDEEYGHRYSEDEEYEW